MSQFENSWKYDLALQELRNKRSKHGSRKQFPKKVNPFWKRTTKEKNYQKSQLSKPQRFDEPDNI